MTHLELDQDPRRPDMARFSPDGVHRYRLTRELGGDRPIVICGLNPSEATAETNDNTIRRDIGFARTWGCGVLIKVNAYGYCAKDPKDMKRARKIGIDVIGMGGGRYPNGSIDPGNDHEIRNAVELIKTTGGIFLVAWGNNIEPQRQREIAKMIGPIACALGVNQNGTPEHELYIPYERPLEAWACP